MEKVEELMTRYKELDQKIISESATLEKYDIEMDEARKEFGIVISQSYEAEVLKEYEERSKAKKEEIEKNEA